MTACICSSESTQRVLPTADNKSCAKVRSFSEVFFAANKPAMPSPTKAGVFGITRTIDIAVGKSAFNRASEIPAAIEITNLSEKSTALKGAQTSANTCGFTANNTTSAELTAATLSVATCTPFSANNCRFSSLGSQTVMFPAG